MNESLQRGAMTPWRRLDGDDDDDDEVLQYSTCTGNAMTDRTDVNIFANPCEETVRTIIGKSFHLQITRT